MRQTAIRIKAEIAIPADVADIEEFQVAAAKANQLKVLAGELGIVVSFDSRIGNIETDDEPEAENMTNKVQPADELSGEDSQRVQFTDEPSKVEAGE